MMTQYGVLAWKESEGGGRSLLLITSRDTKRWVIPRGNPIAGLSPPDAAAQEAWEEAGVRGETAPEPIGAYRYDKRKPDGSSVPAEVEVFAMRVTEEAELWPEAKQRERRWFAPEDAAESVDEPELKALLLASDREEA